MELKEIISLGGFLLALLGILWNFAYGKGKNDEIERNLNNKIDRHISDNEKNNSNISSQLQRIWDWKSAHEKDSSDMRLELQKQIGKVEAGLSIHDAKYNEIISKIDSFSQMLGGKIDKIESRLDKLGHNSSD